MKKIILLGIVALGIIAFVVLIPKQTHIFAEETVDTDSVNDVRLETVFHFRAGDEKIDSFKVFDTLSTGFDRTKPVNFQLQGVVEGDRPLLYKAIDTTFYEGKNVQHEFSEFDVDIMFQRADQQIRQFTYNDCQIKNYNVFTEFDKEETYNKKTDFVYVDKIDFECRGLSLINQPYDRMLEDQKAEKTAEALKNLEHLKNKTAT